MTSKRHSQKPDFKGNKSTLPHKICQQCGRVMTWRKAWAKNWLQVKYCSEQCKRIIKSTKGEIND